MTLIDFLLARLIEEGKWIRHHPGGVPTHIRKRLLAEYKAKWRILERVRDAQQAAADIGTISWPPGMELREARETVGYNQVAHFANQVLADLAAVYADHPDHPDYRDEWRP